MRRLSIVPLIMSYFLGGNAVAEIADTVLPEARPGVAGDKFATLALACVHRAYPNKIAHVLQSDTDARPPQELTPAFYGCYDWHSSVHGHWLLVRILQADPASPFRSQIENALSRSLTAANIRGELSYYQGEGRESFERPYGIAWLLMLVAELHESNLPEAAAWREALRPLEQAIVARVRKWLGNLHYPIRVGTHNQTAFAFTLMLDYARITGNSALETLVTDKAVAFYRDDTACPLSYEPSGEDFLSPCLEEADLMRRILPPNQFAAWLEAFLPELPTAASGDWLTPGIVTDPADGKLAHLHGLNLSRAWALEGIAGALPAGDPRREALLASAETHRARGLAAVSGEHYAGSHWLGTFATYLTTQRGLESPTMPR